MTPELLIELVQQSLLLVVLLSLPPLAAVFLLGLVVGLLQSATGIQDTAIGFAPRFLVALLAIAAAMPWTLEHLTVFSARLFELAF